MSEEGFLARWSRRKQAAKAGRPEPEPPELPGAAAEGTPAPAPLPPAPTATAPAAADKPAFDPATLPPIESLTASSDFSVFLRKEVPEALQRAALRRAWTLDPAIRDFVGLADYAWDFNAPDGITGFALELGEDARRLLAQVFGPDRPSPPAPTPEPVPAAPSPAPEAPKPMPGDDDAAPAAETNVPLAETAAPAVEAMAAAEETTAPAAIAAAPAIGLVGPGEGAAQAAAPRPRRHGSAMPS